jgi:copper(I)-binding protein
VIQKVVTALLIIGSISALAGCSTTGNDISVQNAWARPTAAQVQSTATMASGDAMTSTNAMGDMAMGAVSAAYMTIHNGTVTDDKLIRITSNIADVTEVHQTVQSSDGMTSMQPVQGGLKIPAKGNVELQPGSYHIMITKLHHDLITGQTFSMTLTFQSGKQITVNVPVKDTQ